MGGAYLLMLQSVVIGYMRGSMSDQYEADKWWLRESAIKIHPLAAYIYRWVVAIWEELLG
jgi:hypothetical protein